MKSEKAIAIGVLLMLTLVFLASTCAASIIYVPDKYSTIQEAVNAASPIDTIIVMDGTYIENIEVDKNLTIRSENGADSTIIQAEYPDEHVFNVTADYVEISGFTVEGAYTGIYLYHADYCNISNNSCLKNDYGILLYYSNNTQITENTLINNSCGLYLASSSNNLIYHNNIINNTQQAYDNGSNAWDNGYPSGGNYWSNWIEPDNCTGVNQDIAGFDFFVDCPYDVSEGINRDHYPFTILYGWQKPLFVPDVLLVGFKSGVSPETINTTIANYGAEVIEYFDLVDIYFLKIDVTDCSEWEMVYRFAGDSNVDLAVLDYYTYSRSHLTHPNDPCYRQQWGLNNFGINPGVPKGIIDADIDAPQAWEHKTDCSDIVVAVIDSGIDLTHPDLVGNLWRNPGEIPADGIDNDRNGVVDDIHGAEFLYDPGPPSRLITDGSPDDDDGHGTHCAGIIGAVGNNGVGVAGVNWRASIMAVKTGALRPLGLPPEVQVAREKWGSLSAFTAATNYILRTKRPGVDIRVISYSAGISRMDIADQLIAGGWSRNRAESFAERLLDGVGLPWWLQFITIREGYQRLIQTIDNAHILFVCAAGYDAVDIDAPDAVNPAGVSDYPCKLPNPNIISVTASDNKDRYLWWANSGTSSIDVAAPGEDILSLAMHGQIVYNDIDGNGDVSAGDHRLANVDTVFPPSSVVAASHDDRGYALIAFRANEKHDEVVAANGAYDSEEHVYLDADGNNQVSVGDRRMMAVFIAGFFYRPDTVVAAGDADVGNLLVAFRDNEKHQENVRLNGRYDVGEYIYLDADGDGRVSMGDTRLTRVESFYQACFPVAAGDNDDCYDLVAFGANEKHRENVRRNGRYDAGEYIYVDADGDGWVSAGDKRLTAVPPYAAGTVVAAGDADGGFRLIPFLANERYALVTYMSGTSMATPFVSGAAAHLWSLFPGLTHIQIKQYLESWVDPRSGIALGGIGRVRWGKFNDGRLRMVSGDDFGDASDPLLPLPGIPGMYPTKMRNTGACHEDIGEEWLGFCNKSDVSPEFDADVQCQPLRLYDADCGPNLAPGRVPPNPMPPPFAPPPVPDLDRHDDGVRFPLGMNFMPGGVGSLEYAIRTEHAGIIDARGAGGGRYDFALDPVTGEDRCMYVNIWIDWDRNGWWAPWEQVYASGPIVPGAKIVPRIGGPEWEPEWIGNCSGWIPVTFSVPPAPPAVPGPTWLRIRLDYGEDAGLLPLAVRRYDADHPVPAIIDTSHLAQCGEVEDYNVTVCKPGIEVNKTVWNPATGKWEISRVAKVCDQLKFKCEIHARCCNLTNITVTDILSCSLNYTNNATVHYQNGTTAKIEPEVSYYACNNTTLKWFFSKLNKSETITITFDAHKVKPYCDNNTQNVIAWCNESNKWVTVTSNTVDIFDINVNKTVWDPVTEKWVESRVAKKCDDLTFNCTIHPKCCNLTNIKVTDILSKSLNYTDTKIITKDGVIVDYVVNVEPGPDDATKVTWTFPPDFKLEKCQTLTIIFDAHKKLEGCDKNNQIITGKACNKTWIMVKSNTVAIFDINVKKEVWNPATGRWDTSRVAKVCDPLLFRCKIHPKCCNLTNIEVIDILSESLNYTYTENITIDDVPINVTPTVEVEPGPDNTTHVTWTFPPDFKLEKCQNMVIHFFAHKVKCYDDWNTQIVIAKACNKTWVTVKSNTVDIIEAPGLTAKQLRNVVAEDDDYTIEGRATCVDYVDIVLIGPEGYYPIYDPLLDVLNGLAITSTPVTDDEFSENITMGEGVDTGRWIAMVFSPGRGGEYGDLSVGAGNLAAGFDIEVFVVETQDQIVEILKDHTVNVAGSDDLLESFTFKVESPFVKLNPIEPVAVGEPLSVSGVTNREPGTVITISTFAGPVELPAEIVEVEWPTPDEGVFSVTIDTTGALPGTYGLEADDGDGNTDEIAVILTRGPELTAELSTTVVALDDDFTIGGFAPGSKSVNILSVAPKGGDGSSIDGTGTGIYDTVTSISVVDYTFSRKIDVGWDVDTGRYLVAVLSPGLDGEYNGLPSGTGVSDFMTQLQNKYNLAAKTQNQILVIIQDATVDVAGSDDLLWVDYIKVESPFVSLDPIADVGIGEPLVVTGESNRKDGYPIVVTCKGPVELDPQTVKLQNGTFSVTFDTTGAKEGKYTVKADDGDGHTDELTVEIVTAVPTPPPEVTPTPSEP